VGAAARAGAELVALPENAVWLRLSATSRAPMEAIDDARPGPNLATLKAMAREAGVWLLVGSFPELSPSPNHYYNTSIVIDPDGVVSASYRKLHLFDIDVKDGESQRESDSIARGDEIVATPIRGVMTGLTICYDLRFPALYQRLVDRGARILTAPSAFTEFTGKDHWLVLLRARAIETETFVIAPGQSGFHGGRRRSFGKSAIIDPWGIPLCIAPDGPGFALARLDFAAQDRIRTSLPCLSHRHPKV
jgi:predicted amidohydrolase